MHETDDRVIYIKDLFFVMLYQWRKIVIIAVALALLAGVVFGFQAHRSSAAIQADPDFSAKLEAGWNPFPVRLKIRRNILRFLL